MKRKRAEKREAPLTWHWDGGGLAATCPYYTESFAFRVALPERIGGTYDVVKTSAELIATKDGKPPPPFKMLRDAIAWAENMNIIHFRGVKSAVESGEANESGGD